MVAHNDSIQETPVRPASLFAPGQAPWNKGTGGCKRGHGQDLWVCPPSGVWICLGCKRENGASYRAKNKKAIHMKGRLARYQLSVEIFQALWIAQSGLCAICQRNLAEEKYHIDHDHCTGQVRGLLCVACNTGLGLFQDSPDRIERAASYLRAKVSACQQC